MPWEVEKRGDKFVVVKEDTGEVVGTHPSKEKAMTHMKALYANIKELENFDVSFTAPIEVTDSIQEGEVKWLKFGGTCLKPTVSRNKVKYTPENINEMDGQSAKFFVTHDLSPDNSVGHVNFIKEGDALKYDARIRNTAKHPDITEAVKDKRVDVSIDARFKKIWQEVDNGEKVYKASGLEVRGLCAVGVGGVSENSIEYAIAEEFGKVERKYEEIVKQIDEVKNMEESEQLKQVLLENEELKKKLKEQEDAKKLHLVEEVLSINKELDKNVLIEKSLKELEMIRDYEKKLSEPPKKKKCEVGEAEVEVKSISNKEPEILIEKDGTISMSNEMYSKFNEDIKKKL